MMASRPWRRPRNNSDEDVCGCCKGGCYPNGLVSLLAAQVLLLLGLMLSALSAVDCRFVVANVFIDGEQGPPLDTGTGWAPEARTGFGFLAFQNESGSCTFEAWFEDDPPFDDGEEEEDSTNNDEEDFESVFVDYLDFLGSDWDKARGVMAATVAAALGMFIWSLTMVCIAHMRPLRILAGTIPVLIIPLQLSTFIVLDSDFCSQRDCELGRSAVAGSVSTVMYFFAVVGLCLTKNYAPSLDEDLGRLHGTTPEQRHASTDDSQGAIEMVEVVQDASFVIEGSRAAAGSDQHVQEVVIGDGLAEAQEIKPDMVFLHQDGEIPAASAAAASAGSPLNPIAASAAAAAAAGEIIPTATDVRIIDEDSKTKVAP